MKSVKGGGGESSCERANALRSFASSTWYHSISDSKKKKHGRRLVTLHVCLDETLNCQQNFEPSSRKYDPNQSYDLTASSRTSFAKEIVERERSEEGLHEFQTTSSCFQWKYMSKKRTEEEYRRCVHWMEVSMFLIRPFLLTRPWRTGSVRWFWFWKPLDVEKA